MTLAQLRAFDTTRGIHGGTLRSDQILHLLHSISPDAGRFSVREAVSTSLGGELPRSLRHALMPGRPQDWQLRRLKERFANELALHTLGTRHTVVWEPRPGLPPRGSAISGVRADVVAVPHNIESLVETAGRGPRALPRTFRQEIEAYGACKAVFTISREDGWLLELFGVQCQYLPYYPPPARVDYLREIHASRHGELPDTILCLGTATNPPTRTGLHEIMRALRSVGGQAERVVHIGAADASFRSAAEALGVSCKGFLSDKEMGNELGRARVAVVWQTQTTGWPTRLVELPLAGVPVLANQAALRAQPATQGVTSVASVAEAVDVIRSDTFCAGGTDRSRPHEESRFTEHLRQICG